MRKQVSEEVHALVKEALRTDSDDTWALAWGAYQTPAGEKPSGVRGKTEGPWRIPFLAWRRAQEMRHGAVEAAARTLSKLKPDVKACSKGPQQGGSVPRKKKPSGRKCSNCGDPKHTKAKCPKAVKRAPKSRSRDGGVKPDGPKAKSKTGPEKPPRDARRASKNKPKPAKKTPKPRARRRGKPPTADEHIEQIDKLLSAAMLAYEENLPEAHRADDETLAVAVVEWAIATAIGTEVGEDQGALLKLVVRSLNDLVEDAYDEDGGDDYDEDDDDDDDDDDGDDDDYDAIPKAILERINGFPSLN